MSELSRISASEPIEAFPQKVIDQRKPILFHNPLYKKGLLLRRKPNHPMFADLEPRQDETTRPCRAGLKAVLA
jgi:hypothetical protein